MATLFDYPEGGDDSRSTTAMRGDGEVPAGEFGGVMCPTYQVTRGELHSTRGRAHLLWEMLQRRRVDGQLAVDRSTRRAGPVPVLQGMSLGLSGECGHGDVEGRVHPALYWEHAVEASDVALVDGLAAAVVAARLAGAGDREPVCRQLPARGWVGWRRSGTYLAFTEKRFAEWFARREGSERWVTVGRLCCGRTRSRTTWRRRSAGRR